MSIRYGKDYVHGDGVGTINTAEELQAKLPDICKAIFDVLGKRNLEATYQRALKVDLTEAGVSVEEEISIDILYKGKTIGTRRCDLVVQTKDGAVAIIELKAVSSLNGQHLRQLEYYLAHFQVGTGFLINFPHEVGFPDVDELGDDVFTQLQLCGSSGVLSDRATRSDSSGGKVFCEPQVVKVSRVAKSAASSSIAPEKGGFKEEFGSRGAATNEGSAIYGITQAGTPCKICLREQRFCRYHKPTTRSSIAPEKGGFKEEFGSRGAATNEGTAIYGITQAGTPCKICIREQRFCRYHQHQSPK